MALEFSKDIYGKTALLKTAYSFSDRVFIHLSQNELNWVVEWKPKDHISLSTDEFENELIHNQLRFELLNETGDVRKVLLARALASTITEKASDNDVISMAPQDTENILKGWFVQNE